MYFFHPSDAVAVTIHKHVWILSNIFAIYWNHCFDSWRLISIILSSYRQLMLHSLSIWTFCIENCIEKIVSRSVLDALSSSCKKSNVNYLIPLCRSKFQSLIHSDYSINLAWIPSHVGIPSNEKIDHLAKQTPIYRRKPKFKISYTDTVLSQLVMREKSFALLKENFLIKRKLYHSFYYKDIFPTKP